MRQSKRSLVPPHNLPASLPTPGSEPSRGNLSGLQRKLSRKDHKVPSQTVS